MSVLLGDAVERPRRIEDAFFGESPTLPRREEMRMDDSPNLDELGDMFAFFTNDTFALPNRSEFHGEVGGVLSCGVRDTGPGRPGWKVSSLARGGSVQMASAN